ncbi:hypothetical protein HPB51_003838 [Rhipicephalus microplus]|uniref:Uncharacterized protein n=1 Tax=Rhipicephalus microplus TaxID=6941 RepID=A0A9J6ELK0_RHIMP|nr:hypothetical protein HPB51_003838 [Rhipicephalus microplus]
MPINASSTLTFTALWNPDPKQDAGLYVRRYQQFFRAYIDSARVEVSDPAEFFNGRYECPEKTASQTQEEPVNTSNARNPEHFPYERAIEIGCFCTSVIPCFKLGTNFVLVLGLRNKFKARQILGRLSRRCDIGTIFSYASVSVHDVGPKMEAMRKWYDTHVTDRVGYECCYALCALMLQSSDLAAQLVLLSQQGLLEGFSKTLREFASHNQALLEPALFAVSADIEARHIVTIP